MEELFKKYQAHFEEYGIQNKVAIIANNSHQYASSEVFKLLFSLIDLTSLNTEDNSINIRDLVYKVNGFENRFSNMPNVAAICVYPGLVEHVQNNLIAQHIHIASVAGGFPSSQTFTSIKIEECKQAIEKGATEIDIVLPVGKFLENDYTFCYEEIKSIKRNISGTRLKVILETGALKSYQHIYNASILAMEAGADFIKTSTGKQQPAATKEAVYIMAMAIKKFYNATGKKVGIKPAGGISTSEDALAYYAIVKESIGDEWLNSEYFRIGASRLANNLLSSIYTEEVTYF